MTRTRLLIAVLLSAGLVAGVLVFLFPGRPAAATTPAANDFCPVMTGKAVTAEHEIEYQGKPVRFCCQRCRETFLANPSTFLIDLPQFKPAEPAPAATMSPSDWLRPVIAWIDGWEIALAVILVALVALLLVLRRRMSGATATRRLRGGVIAGALLFLALVGLSAVLLRQQVVQQGEFDQLKKEMSRRDKEIKGQQDMLEFTLQQARAGMPNRIKCSFYRGNDERDPGLIFGGNYRTATFHLSLLTEDGREVQFGDHLLGQAVWFRLEIERAPYTADGFFDDLTMNSVLLTRGSGSGLRREAVTDARVLTELERKQLWEVRYPLGGVTEVGLPLPRGLLYLCLAENQNGRRVPSQFHYWIHHDLFFKDGRLEPESNLWMGPIYLVPNLRGPRLKEWFSHEPIPVLPGKNTDDPKLLGLDVHRAP